MDPFEIQNFTFLDLSDVDEQERGEVLEFLYADNSNVELPWTLPKRKPLQKNDAKKALIPTNNNSNHYEENNHKIVPQSPHHQIYLTSPAYLASPASNTPIYPATPAISYTIPQSQYVVYSTLPSNYQSFAINTIVTNNVTFVPTTLTNAYLNNDLEYSNNVQNDYGDYVLPANEGNVAPPLPIYEDNEANIKMDNTPTNIDNFIPSQEQNGTEEEKPQIAGVKTWASLFSNKSKTDASNVVDDNNLGKSSFNEAVNRENNNEEQLCPIKNPRKTQFIDPNCYRMGEFLLNHNVDGRTISLQPRGLINRSNYCYINSILQALLACPPVYNLLTGLSQQNTSQEKEKATPIIDGMCRFVNEFKHLPPGLRVNRRNEKNQKKEQGISIDYDLPFEPTWIYKMLNGIRTDSFLIEGRQEDAEEFLGCLLNGLNDEMLELMKLVKGNLTINKLIDKTNNEQESDTEWQVMGPKNKGGITRQLEFTKTPISNIFGGFLKSRICRTGDHSTYNIQPFFTLQLNIEKVNTVREALDALVSKNQLEGVTSEKTNEEVEAWQQVTLEELPIILILHLKCFDFKLDGCTKIVKALDFPIDLKIDSKLLSSKPTTPKEKQYKLFAVVYHDGKEATKGHYITDAFHVGYSSWIRYDDASVKPVQEEHVLKPQGTRVPYLLFYRRSDTIRSK